MARAGANFAADHLRSFVSRIERMEEEKKALVADIREIYSEAKGMGFDTKTLRNVVKIRGMDKGEYEESQEILDLYLHVAGHGMLPEDNSDLV